jgi:hypothetical protein
MSAANKGKRPRTLPALRPQDGPVAENPAPEVPARPVKKMRDDASTLPRLFCLRSPKPKPAPTEAEQALNRELVDARTSTRGSRTWILFAVAVVLLVVLFYLG